MGHASLAVSLGYLRNLEVPMLKVEDMPLFRTCPVSVLKQFPTRDDHEWLTSKPREFSVH